MTTPGLSISLNKQSKKLIAGIQITASHNLYQDNGIKIFNSLGMKLDDNLEKENYHINSVKWINSLSKSKKLEKEKQLDDKKWVKKNIISISWT